MPQFALRLAYDGTDFAGWWRQPGLRCVASHVDQAGMAIGEPQLHSHGIARTDGGVHARAQIARVSCQRQWSAAAFCQALNRQLDGDCRCLGAAAVDQDWDLLGAADSKTYCYRCDSTAHGDPFQRRWAWRAPLGADWQLLQKAAHLLQGRHDFRCFLRRGDYRQDTVCNLEEVRWLQEHGQRQCWMRGNRFIYRLARSLVGCMWSIARGSSSLNDLEHALNQGVANPATQQQAPAHGLCLEQVSLIHELNWSA